MEKKNDIWQELSKESGYKLPEGYFENITARVMERLPQQPEQETPTVTLWTKVRPILYMAAMFVGIALFLNIVKWSSDAIATVPQQALLVSPTEGSVDEFVLYSSMDEYALIEYIYASGYE